jgi:hypothetical protein
MTSLLAAGAISSSAALLAATDFQRLDDRSLQIIQAYYLAQIGTGSFPTGAVASITVSAKGITNGLATVANNGSRFGPDTPGTQTSGIQEALNSIPPGGPQWGTNTTGALIRLDGGDFYATNSIFYSNTFPYSVRLQGAGILASRIAYAGSARTNLIRFCGGGNPNAGLMLPGQVELEDITFTSITNDLIALVVITNVSYSKVRDCNFTGWEITTNNTHGAQLSIDGPYPTQPLGNVGLVIGNANDHATFVEDCFFANLATGVQSFSDHLYLTGFKSAFIGVYIGGGSGADGTGWANTSPYSLGACILLMQGIGAYIDRPHFYIANGGIVLDAAQDVSVINPQWEQADHAYAAFVPTGQQFLVHEPVLDGDESATFAVLHSPYSYSASTALDIRHTVSSKMIQGIGLNGNNNVATNFASIRAGDLTGTNGVFYASSAGLCPINTNFTSYASGTAYTMTITPTQLTFGTTSPGITIQNAGTYMISSTTGVKYNGITYAGAQTINLKLRRTNNTPADLTNGGRTVEMPIAAAAFTDGEVMPTPAVIYTATAGDIIQLFGSVSALPGVGTVQTDSAEIVAIRIF